MAFAKDGAQITIATVVRFDCTKCGTLETTRYPQNDREIDAFILNHLRQHGGSIRSSK